jgi:hypothetical protein
MKFKLPKIKKIKFTFSLKYFYAIFILLIIGASAILILFLYKNFYVTIAQTEQIILLKKEVAPDFIDIDRVNKVLNALAEKATTPEITE